MRRPLIYTAIVIISTLNLNISLRADDDERDPFISVIDIEKQRQILTGKKTVNLTNVSLKGIIWNTSNSIAIINDELVMAGDNWQEFKVEHIDKDSVTLSSQGNSYKLSTEDVPSPGKEDSPSVVPELPQPDDFNPTEERVSYEGGQPWR